MVEKASIKNTFIHSTIFETPEDIQNNPFEFRTDNLQTRKPTEIPNIYYQGYLLRLQVRKSSRYPNIK